MKEKIEEEKEREGWEGRGRGRGSSRAWHRQSSLSTSIFIAGHHTFFSRCRGAPWLQNDTHINGKAGVSMQDKLTKPVILGAYLGFETPKHTDRDKSAVWLWSTHAIISIFCVNFAVQWRKPNMAAASEDNNQPNINETSSDGGSQQFGRTNNCISLGLQGLR